MKIAERLRRLAEAMSGDVGESDLTHLGASATLPLANADAMIENAIGVLGLPVGLGLNFLVNGEEVLVPVAVAEPAVISPGRPAGHTARQGGRLTARSGP